MTEIVKTLDSPRSILHWTGFAGLISIAILLRIVGFQGYSDSDPRFYAVLADDLAHGILSVPGYNGPPVFPLRFGVYGPTAILIKAFGLSELTLAAYPFLISIAGCLLAYATARWLYGPLAGLICMGILAVLPIDISMASTLFPDAVAAFWANVGIALTYLGLTRERQYQSIAYTIAGGIVFGVSWLCKESVAYLAPFVGIYILCLHPQATPKAKLESLLCVGFGSLLVLSAEAIFFNALAGDPLFRFHETERNFEQDTVWFFHQSSPHYGWESAGHVKALVRRLAYDGPWQLLSSFSAIPAFAVLALSWSVAVRTSRFVVPGVWLVTLLLMFNFASSSFREYLPLPMTPRYLYLLLLPSVLLVGGFLATLLASKDNEYSVRMERKFWAMALIVVYCVFSVRELPKVLATKPEQVERLVGAKVAGTDVVYTDYRTASSLVFFRTGTLLPSTSTTIPYENLSLKDMSTGAYVLIDKKMTDFLTLSYNYQPPSFVRTPPGTWREIWTNGDAVLLLIESIDGNQDWEDGAAKRIGS